MSPELDFHYILLEPPYICPVNTTVKTENAGDSQPVRQHWWREKQVNVSAQGSSIRNKIKNKKTSLFLVAEWQAGEEEELKKIQEMFLRNSVSIVLLLFYRKYWDLLA